MSERVAVVVAHPDDESFFMGGTIARHVRQGDSVDVFTLSDGVGSRFHAYGSDEHGAAACRRLGHFTAACAVLGAHPWARDVFRDQESDKVSQLTINRAVACVMDGATVVYTHHIGDLNIDHRHVAEAVFVWARGKDVRLFSMRPEWPKLCVGQPWQPNTWVTTIKTFETKVKACACYVDELREAPHPRSLAVINEQLQEGFMRIQ
jgi:LmbE family N-acetylglucosaminyl deacetylase